MGVTVGVNGLSVVHKSSGGISAAFPDVCKTPMPPAGPVPIPYPNIAQSSDTDKGSKNVKIDGNPVCLQDSNFKQSTGNEAGSAGGIASGKTKGKAEFVNYSFDVKIEGKCVPRAFDPMIHNDKNTPPFPLIQPPIITMPPQASEEDLEDVELESMEEDEEGEDGSGSKTKNKCGGVEQVTPGNQHDTNNSTLPASDEQHPDNTPKQEEGVKENGKILEVYFEDCNGNKTDITRPNQSVFLVVKTVNMVGEKVEIDLSDVRFDYDYNDKVLNDDIIKDLEITADNMKIKLKSISGKK